jgi:2'-5' RNA ligase
MHGIVSLLDPIYNQHVEELWHKLEVDCGLKGIQVTPIPHFSWHVAQDYNQALLKPALEEIAKISQPFVVRTTGVGLFTGDNPVIFIPLVKDSNLLRMHEQLWERIKSAAVGPNPHYSPELWMPHITLSHGDLDGDRFLCAMEKLVIDPYKWEIKVDNIALISQAEGQIGKEAFHFMLGF